MKGGDRRRMRRPGAVVLALLFGTTAAALALTLHYDLGVPGLVVAFLLGLPALYLGWVALQDAPPRRSLAQTADGLAGRLRSQWEREAEARGLNDPYPLPVAWAAADAPLAGDLDTLKRLAASGAGWSLPTREHWAAGPEDLTSGDDRKLADVLAAVPTRRLVVLGEPGSGKTMLMVGLVLDLLARRRRGGPVPVLASLASWDPLSQDLHGWLGATLITDYPDLASAPPPGSAGDNCFQALLAAGLILPILDGLDEIPESARPTAVTRINKELRPGEHVVVTCRTEQYQAALSLQDGQGAVLQAAAVQLSTMDFDEVANYLRKDAGPAAQGRWDFLDTLGTESPTRQALATPLMAGLARVIYNPRPDERTREPRHPAELCGFADRTAVEARLLDAFIPAAWSSTGSRWTATQAEMWLTFLARYLEQTIGGSDLAWWKLERAAPRTAFRLPAGLVGALTGVLAGRLLFGPAGGLAGLAVGLVYGLAVGRMSWLRNVEAPARGMRIGVRRLAGVLVCGSALVVVGMLVGGLVGGLALGLVGALAGGALEAVTVVPGNLAGVTSPRSVLARDRQVTLLRMLPGALVGGLLGGLTFGLAFGLAGALFGGLTTGLATELWGESSAEKLRTRRTAWPSYMLARGWLALHHRLPWSLMNFLADAHRRGVLRQVGAVYQFRHIELQHRLATRP